MTAKTYLQTKDSGISWIGDIPLSWSVSPLLAIADERTETNRGMVENNLLSLSYGNIVRKDITANDGLLPESFETYQIVRAGDLVWRLTDLQNDKRSLRTGLVEETGIITAAYVATEPKAIDPRYFAYQIRAYDQAKVFYSMGGGLRQSMKYSDIKRLPIILPSRAEQSAIVAFLDRETVKIGALIEEQKRLIELLKEKRQAVISHAVTKGLDPSVPMKDSGIEWLGQVPAHWEVGPLKTFLGFQEGPGIMASDFTEDGLPLIRVAGVKGKLVTLDGCNYLDPKKVEQKWAHFAVKKGDYILSASASLGDVSEVGDEAVGSIPYTGLIRLFPRTNMLKREFIPFLMSSNSIKEQIASYAQGATMQHFGPFHLRKMIAALPPKCEQDKICKRLISSVLHCDDLISEANAAVVLLHERRAALISAAVTGKIDVRGLVSDEVEAA